MRAANGAAHLTTACAAQIRGADAQTNFPRSDYEASNNDNAGASPDCSAGEASCGGGNSEPAPAAQSAPLLPDVVVMRGITTAQPAASEV